MIDDGGHIARQQATSFEILFRKLAFGGVYMVEDTHLVLEEPSLTATYVQWRTRDGRNRLLV